MTDIIIFGSTQSEKEHNFKGESLISEGGLKLMPTVPPSRFSTEVSFTVKVDPYKQNYFSLKLHSSDKYTPIFLYIDGKQLGYAKCGDFEALNLCYGDFKPANYFYVTTAIPIWYTKNKSEIELTIRQAEPYDDVLEVRGTIFEAYSTVSPTFDLPENKTPLCEKQAANYTKKDIDAFSQSYIDAQVEFFNSALAKLRNGEKLSITKYVEEFRHFCMMLFEPYCPLKDKSEAVRLIMDCINSYVKDYFENPQSLLHTSHQSDWGGYYGELGQGLYIIEKLIDNTWFDSFLSSPFDEHLTKKEAWEICLKANFDFASCRQSYIYNQTYYTYEGAWKAMAGLGVIGSKYYIGKEKCDLILKEALGLAPWKGEHILFHKNGRELDLYHCLFHHDKTAVFTDDFINIVCTGEAVQGKDENGDFLRRKPYGENYYPLTHRCMPRENGYVGNYGETANYLPEWVYRTFNHGDLELSDLILKAALENINSRMYMRYFGADENNNPIMFMEQAIDERNPTMNAKPAYGAIINDNRTLLFASLKRHMDEHSERYASKEWDKYKLYAQKAVDALRQQHLDGHLEPVLNSLGANYNDFKVDRTIKDIFATGLTYLLPHSPNAECKDFVFFDIDNLLLSLRDNDTHIFAQLNHRSRGFNGYGRAHIIKNGTHHLTQAATDGIFRCGGKFIRQQNVNMDFIYDKSGSNSFFRAPQPLREFGATAQALCGEEQSITYQPGIGKVIRENYEVDTPYSGYPDVIWTKIDKYFIICNTTRESYKNAKSYKVNTPIGTIEIEPFSYKVIKTDDSLLTPSSVKVLNALIHSEGVLLSWKESEGESYNIYRDGKLICNTTENVYLDKGVQKGKKYTYTVCSLNKNGESVPSPCKDIFFTDIPDYVGAPTDIIHFGEGNDYHARERDIKDNLPFCAEAVYGSQSIISDCGIMLRESYDENARYAYMGFENGKIVIRTRSKNTIYAPDLSKPHLKISPLYYEFEKGDYTRLKLLADKDLHSVVFFAGKNGSWDLIHREILPLPSIYYIGTTNFCKVPTEKEEYDFPFPIKNVYLEKTDAGLNIEIEKGIDNKYLLVESSPDKVNYTVLTDSLISQTFFDESPKAYYRITPINRHGIMGKSITVKMSQDNE